MPTPESEVKADISAFLNSLGPRCRVVMPIGGEMSEIGVSDYVGLCDGLGFAIEAKATGKSKVKLSQKLFLADIRRAGGLALVVHAGNLEDFKLTFLDKLHAPR